MGQTDVDTPGCLHDREMDGGPGLPRAFPEVGLAALLQSLPSPAETAT